MLATAYSYDAVGNRLTGPASETYNYNAGNALTELNYKINASPANAGYEYDLNGNRTKKTEGSLVTSYTYDDENRLVQVSDGTNVITYTYDPFGRRIEKNVNGVITQYLYDQESIVLEYENGTVKIRYTHGLNIDEPLAVQQNDKKIYYYHADGLGSVVALTSESGNSVQTYTYDSFGNIIKGKDKINQPFTYTAREFDSETGLYYYRARYYDAKAGRFITRDPIGFVGGDVNLYAYVKNNPVNWVDPSGMVCGSWWNDWAVPEAPGGHDFSNCCQKHDDCYSGKNGQCNKTKQQCDDEFSNCMKRVCDYQHLSSKNCYSDASKYSTAVRKHGGGAFKSARKKEPCCQK